MKKNNFVVVKGKRKENLNQIFQCRWSYVAVMTCGPLFETNMNCNSSFKVFIHLI